MVRKSSKNNNKVTAFVESPCYDCGKVLSSPAALIKHLSTLHKIELPKRPASTNRRPSPRYEFVGTKTKPHRRTLFGCPSCWFHCPQDLKRLERHIRETHLEDLGYDSEAPEDEDFSAFDNEEEIPQDDRSAQTGVLSKIDELTNSFKSLFSY